MKDLVGECNLGTTQTSSPTMFIYLTIQEKYALKFYLVLKYSNPKPKINFLFTLLITQNTYNMPITNSIYLLPSSCITLSCECMWIMIPHQLSICGHINKVSRQKNYDRHEFIRSFKMYLFVQMT